MKKENNISPEKIFEIYGDFILNNGERPKNIYLFAKENNFEEKDFYNYFASFEHIEKLMITHLFERSVELASEVNDTDTITAKEKLLNVYFIFFENMAMNRSLVLMILGKDKMNSIKILQSLKEAHKSFVKTLDFNEMEILKNAKGDVKNFIEKSREEALWLHLMSCIEFWKKDNSPSFEKTDLFIEKTVDTGFELIDNEPLRKIVDLGKFLWKEKFKAN